MSYPAAISTGVTTVDCQKQVRSWRLLRSLIQLLIPTCNRTFIETNHQQNPKPNAISPAAVTGTIFAHRRGKINFYIQTNTKSKSNTNPFLILELAIPTTILAREMQTGNLRIALKSSSGAAAGDSLFSIPVWIMYVNGRRAGYAIKRRPSKADMDALGVMNSVVAGAGIINGKELNCDDEVMYLRAKFERVFGSIDSESFHLIDPDGKFGQDLSIFFFRSK